MNLYAPFFQEPSNLLRPTPRSKSLNKRMVVLSIILRLRILNRFNRQSGIMSTFTLYKLGFCVVTQTLPIW
jgi:hypothetical protein